MENVGEKSNLFSQPVTLHGTEIKRDKEGNFQS